MTHRLGLIPGDSKRTHFRHLGAAVSVPINMVNGLAGLLVSKGVITRSEFADVLRSLIAQVPSTEDAPWVRSILQTSLNGFLT